jgi:hypothetical protein
VSAGLPRRVPPYLKPSLVAKACGLSRKEAKSLLRRARLLERIGTHDYVAESKLRDSLPEVYDRVYAHVVLGPNGTHPTQTDTESARAR